MLVSADLSTAMENACLTATALDAMDKLGKAAFDYISDNLDIVITTTAPGSLVIAAKCDGYTYPTFIQPSPPDNGDRVKVYSFLGDQFKACLQTMKFKADTIDINYLPNGSFSLFTGCYGLDTLNLLFTLTPAEASLPQAQIKKLAFDKLADRIILWFKNTYTQLTGTVTTVVEDRVGKPAGLYTKVIGTGTMFTSELANTNIIKIGSRISMIDQIDNDTRLYVKADMTEQTDMTYGFVTGIIPILPILGATYNVYPGPVPTPVVSFAVSVA